MERSQSRSDEELLQACRAGDTEAFSELWEMHRGAGIVAARSLAPGLEAEDVVSEAYLKIFTLVRDGRGPQGAFRPYLYQVIKTVAADRLRSPERLHADIESVPELHEAGPWEDNAFDLNAVAQAWETLSPRWQAALWYTEVEQLPPREAAKHLGLSANSTSALAARARSALQSAWVEAHANREVAAAECRSTLERLQRYQRGTLTARAGREVAAHLEHCEQCAQVAAEFGTLNRRIGLVLAGIVLGMGGAAALLQTLQPTAAMAAALPAFSGTGAASAGSTTAGTVSAGSVSAGTVSAGTITAGTVGAGATAVGAGIGGAALVASGFAAAIALVAAAAIFDIPPMSEATAAPPTTAELAMPAETSPGHDDEQKPAPPVEAEPPADSAAAGDGGGTVVAAEPAAPAPTAAPVAEPPVTEPPVTEPPAPVDPEVVPPVTPPAPYLDETLSIGFACFTTAEYLGSANAYGAIDMRATMPGGAPIELIHPDFDPANPASQFVDGVYTDSRGNVFTDGFMGLTAIDGPHDWATPRLIPFDQWGPSAAGIDYTAAVLEARLVTPSGAYSPWTVLKRSGDAAPFC